MICFSSVCTNDSYSYYIPMFVYTVKRAYPKAACKVFVKGKLKQEVRDILDLIPYDNWEVKDECFRGYPNNPSMTNSLRFLVSKQEYEKCKYVFVKDIDFLIFRHNPSHERLFVKRMRNLPYFGARGPYRRPRRYNINKIGWKKDFTRVAGGSFVFKNPDWFKKTGKILNKYRKCLKFNESDGFDSHKPASYREYDEVMLYRIIKSAGLRTPTRKNKNAYGYHAPKLYRDLHFGDFIKRKHSFNRVSKRISIENVKNFAKLEKDPTWQKIRDLCKKNDKIRENIRRVQKYVKRRLSS